jgi:hypothetical protein
MVDLEAVGDGAAGGGGGKAPRTRRAMAASAATSSKQQAPRAQAQAPAPAGFFAALRSPLTMVRLRVATLAGLMTCVLPDLRPSSWLAQMRALASPLGGVRTVSDADDVINDDNSPGPAPQPAATPPAAAAPPPTATQQPVLPATGGQHADILQEKSAQGWSPTKVASLSFFFANRGGGTQPAAAPSTAPQLSPAAPPADVGRPYLGLKYLLQSGPQNTQLPHTWISAHASRLGAGNSNQLPANAPLFSGAAAALQQPRNPARYQPYSLAGPLSRYCVCVCCAGGCCVAACAALCAREHCQASMHLSTHCVCT